MRRSSTTLATAVAAGCLLLVVPLLAGCDTSFESTQPSTTVPRSTTASTAASTAGVPAGTGTLPSPTRRSPDTTSPFGDQKLNRPSSTAVQAEACAAVVELVNLVIDQAPFIDPDSASVTADRLRDPVGEIRSVLDELARTAPNDIRAQVSALVTWLEDLAAARSTQTTPVSQFDEVRAWYANNCGAAR